MCWFMLVTLHNTLAAILATVLGIFCPNFLLKVPLRIERRPPLLPTTLVGGLAPSWHKNHSFSPVLTLTGLSSFRKSLVCLATIRSLTRSLICENIPNISLIELTVLSRAPVLASPYLGVTNGFPLDLLFFVLILGSFRYVLSLAFLLRFPRFVFILCVSLVFPLPVPAHLVFRVFSS